MARIKVEGDYGTADLGEPDEDGDYRWTCANGHRGDAFRPIDEAVADAESHVDMRRCVPPDEGRGSRL
jgi:hypothetical protein